MTTRLIIQLLLIVATVAIAWRLLLGYGQKAQAVRRLGLLALAGLAIVSILFPNTWQSLADLVGVGRGTDLILYATVVAFFSFVVTTFKRFRTTDIRYTRLARRIALDETPAPTEHPALAHLRAKPEEHGPTATEPDHPDRPDTLRTP